VLDIAMREVRRPATLDALKRIEDFSADDRLQNRQYSYTYGPTIGTIVDVNGAKGAAIEGADFAVALLGIMIGPEPPNEDLKTGLLTGKCE
jgi:hypothetical protein